MEKRIKMTCEGCNEVYDLRKTSEIPDHVFFMRCNWCPSCEINAKEDYEEWYDENESGEPEQPTPDNQLCMPFLFEEIGIETNVKEYTKCL